MQKVPRYLEKLTPVEEAVKAIMEAVKPVAEEELVDTWTAVGRVLSRDVVAAYDFPPRPRSAYDGYAVRSGDTPGRLRLLGEATIGRVDVEYRVEPGTAVYVSTGAYLPDGADTVVPEEKARRENGYIIVEKHYPPGKNLDPVGAYARRGQVLLPKGYVVTMLDAVGLLDVAVTRIYVYRRVRLAMILTGNEIFELRNPMEAEERVLRGEVVESTGRLIEWAIRRYTPWVEVLGRVLLPDDVDTIAWYVTRQFRNADVIVMTGGSGPSTVDTFYQLAERLGGRVLFRGLYVKGGRPTSALKLDKGPLLIVLSGHPISALHGFVRVLYPVLKYLGNVVRAAEPPAFAYAVLEEGGEYKRPQPVKVKLILRDGVLYAKPLPGERQLSSVTVSNVEADGIALVEGRRYNAGERVPVIVYREPSTG
ncbi:molybdopterin molybdotransferase MoeA [Hyperthermus butylicus]|uniref:Molybdopterin biosynthesis protein n=1 Tax=Hyperthermus butylicus (strain DSM 5456 / JCM 9403 / PLM1-5) TaxID=415426 RepID=A2BJ44_HYPBU|nr:molybdopterin molybdotransferase MoeA [Hyperthermus butylicus]ABM80005.1 Molybdopterin biosynthesis protein [Hyperthermus butylicus DSM 5456]